MKEGRKEGNSVLGHEEDVLLERGNRPEILRDGTCHPDISGRILALDPMLGFCKATFKFSFSSGSLISDCFNVSYLGVCGCRRHFLTLKNLQQTPIPAPQPLWYGQFNTHHRSSSPRSAGMGSTTQITTTNSEKKRTCSMSACPIYVRGFMSVLPPIN